MQDSAKYLAQNIKIKDLFQPANSGKFDSVGDLGSFIFQILLYFGIILAVIFIIIGGYKFITSGGDPGKAASARSTLIYAIIGLILMFFSIVIMYLVQATFINNAKF